MFLRKLPPRCRRGRRPISVSVVPPGPGIDMWRSCSFLGSFVAGIRFLCLEGWEGSFHVVPIAVAVSGTLGWEKGGLGLTFRLRETSSVRFLDGLLLFRYPGSGVAFLAGILPLRFCNAGFAARTPSWKLPSPGHVVDMLAADCRLMLSQSRLLEMIRWMLLCLEELEGLGLEVAGRIRPTQNTPPHLIFREQGLRRPYCRIWKKLHVGAFNDPKGEANGSPSFLSSNQSRTTGVWLNARKTARSVLRGCFDWCAILRCMLMCCGHTHAVTQTATTATGTATAAALTARNGTHKRAANAMAQTCAQDKLTVDIFQK